MNRRLIAAAAVVAVLGVVVWFWRMEVPTGANGTGSTPDSTEGAPGNVVQDDSGRRVLYWHDPMVPGARFNEPGKSPFMDMNLVPRYADEVSDSAVRISPAVMQNLGIRLAPAEVETFGERVTTVGRIEADQRRIFDLPSRVAGFVESLRVRAVGDPVASGQKVAEVYAPELLAAQQELLALSRLQNVPDQQAILDAARERLVLLGMAEREIDAIVRSGRPQTRFGLYSPTSGFVTELSVRQGAQIAPGQTLMRVADLRSVWLVAEVPERAAGRIEPGDALSARLDSVRGKRFEGRVDYVYPTLDTATRTVRVRMVLPNDSGALRPGMYATATIDTAQRESLSVPSEAIIFTGRRSVVIVKEDSGFVPVEVETGAEQAGRTEILEGLQPGATVVASGQFLIDSEASLSGVLARLRSVERDEP